MYTYKNNIYRVNFIKSNDRLVIEVSGPKQIFLKGYISFFFINAINDSIRFPNVMYLFDNNMLKY